MLPHERAQLFGSAQTSTVLVTKHTVTFRRADNPTALLNQGRPYILVIQHHDVLHYCELHGVRL
jgi:hypothetical protein